MANTNSVHEGRSVYDSHDGLEFSKKVDLEKHFLIENKKQDKHLYVSLPAEVENNLKFPLHMVGLVLKLFLLQIWKNHPQGPPKYAQMWTPLVHLNYKWKSKYKCTCFLLYL